MDGRPGLVPWRRDASAIGLADAVTPSGYTACSDHGVENAR